MICLILYAHFNPLKMNLTDLKLGINAYQLNLYIDLHMAEEAPDSF